MICEPTDEDQETEGFDIALANQLIADMTQAESVEIVHYADVEIVHCADPNVDVVDDR